MSTQSPRYDDVLLPTDGSPRAERARDAGLDATIEVIRELPHEGIVDYAEEQDPDLVVMGRSGAGGAEAPHLGSVTDRVLQTTDIPVFPV